MQPATDGILRRIRGFGAILGALLLTFAVRLRHDETGSAVHAPGHAAQADSADREVVDLRVCESRPSPDAARGERHHHEFWTLVAGDEDSVAASQDITPVNWSDPASITGDAANVVETFAVARHGDLLLVAVTIDGHEYPFVVDTGCTWCFVDSTLREHLAPTGRTTLVNGQKDFEVFEMPESYVGASRLPVTGNAVCIDMADLRKWSGHEIRGCLGMTFLKSHVLQIDFDAGILAILKHGPASTDGALDVSYRKGVPTIDVALPNEEVVPFDIDLGMTGGASLKVECFDELVKAGCMTVVDESSGSVTFLGEEPRRDALFCQLSIGKMQHPPLKCHDGRVSALGLGVLSQYVVTIDFPENRLYLRKGKRFGELPRFDMSGLALSQTDGETVVEWVGENSPAEAAGVRGGERLLSINGKRCDDLSLFELKRQLSEKDRLVRLVVCGEGDPRTVEFRLADWQELKLKLWETAAMPLKVRAN